MPEAAPVVCGVKATVNDALCPAARFSGTTAQPMPSQRDLSFVMETSSVLDPHRRAEIWNRLSNFLQLSDITITVGKVGSTAETLWNLGPQLGRSRKYMGQGSMAP